MDNSIPCPRCARDMQQGWIAEIGKGTRPTQWVAGQPEPSFWTTTKMPSEKSYDIVAWACSGCGYLESYVKRS